jgi:hypothetical protein
VIAQLDRTNPEELGMEWDGKWFCGNSSSDQHWEQKNSEIWDNVRKSGKGVIGTGYGWGLIHQYSRFGVSMAVWLLLEKGSDVDARSGKPGDTPLISAVGFGRVDTVRLLLKWGAKVNAQGFRRRTALMTASYCGNVEIIKALLNAGADTEIRDDGGKTAWDIAMTHPRGRRWIGPLFTQAAARKRRSNPPKGIYWLFG